MKGILISHHEIVHRGTYHAKPEISQTIRRRPTWYLSSPPGAILPVQPEAHQKLVFADVTLSEHSEVQRWPVNALSTVWCGADWWRV